MKEVGLFLAENSPKANNTVFERFRAVLHEGAISKRCQYMIEVLFQVRKDRYKDNPSVPEGLDLVEEEEQITHRVTLDDQLQVQEGLSKLFFSFWYEQANNQICSRWTPNSWRMKNDIMRSRRRF
jgi:pre-mRNA-splicing factor CWC22